MRIAIAAVLLAAALPVNAADEAPVLFRVIVKNHGQVVDSPSFLAKVGEPATVRLSDGISIEALAKPTGSDGRGWTQVRITYLDTPDSKMVQEMSMQHRSGLRTGSFEYTDPTNRRYVIQVGNAGR